MSEIKILQEKINELTALVQRRGDSLDLEKVQADLREYIDDLVEKRIEAMPVYPTQTDRALAGVERGNRYYRHAQEIARHGKAQFGPVEVKAADFLLAWQFMRKAHGISPQNPEPSEDLNAVLRTMVSANYGDIIDTALADAMWEDIVVAARVANSLDATPMPTNPFKIPTGFGDPTWRKGVEAQATTSSDLDVGGVTLTATELVAEVDWSYTLDEDTVIQLMPQVRRAITRSGGLIVDAFVLNADSSTSDNINATTPPADAYYLSEGQDGIRHLPLVDNPAMTVDAGGSALTDSAVVEAYAKLDKYGENPSDLVFVMNTRTYVQGFLKAGAGAPAENLMTLDKIGQDAIVITGQVASYRGVPLVVSDRIPLTSANGKVTDTGPNDKGQVILFNRRRWVLGFRRNLLVEVERDIRGRKFYIVASIRPAVAAWGNRTTATHTAAIINIAV